MRPFIRTILGLTAIGVGLMPAAGAASSEGSDYLAEVADEQKVPGLAATVVTREATELEWLHGEDGNGKPVTRDTPFLIGSLAKSMTATVVLQHVDDGALQLSE